MMERIRIEVGCKAWGEGEEALAAAEGGQIEYQAWYHHMKEKSLLSLETF